MARRPKSPTFAGRSQVLQDHKKVGSKLVPPVLAHINLTELSYVRDLLPEICWIGLANYRLGYQKGVNLCSTVAQTAKDSCRPEKFVNFGLCSSYENLDATRRQDLLRTLQAKDLLKPLQEALEPLTTLYPECSLSFIGLPSLIAPRQNLLDILRQCVGQMIDKYDSPAVAAQATLLYIRGITGGLYFVRGVEPPDLNAIFVQPTSDAASRAATMVRAAVMQEIMTVEGPRVSHWAQVFWNNALRIDECRFEVPENDR